MIDQIRVGRIESDAPGADLDATTFRVLGPVEVRSAGGKRHIPSPGRQQAILASLVIDANRVVSTDSLVDVLWEDAPPSTARAQVQICVSRLRKTLTQAGVNAPIHSQAPGYLLEVDPSQTDIHVFTDLLIQAKALGRENRPAEASLLLRSAVSLWRGPCLSGIPHHALRNRAIRLDEDRLHAIETYLELDLDLGMHNHLVGELTKLVHEFPLRERLRGLLMRALHLSGRQAEALAVYRTGRDMLIEELGLEPGESLRALEQAILSGDSRGLQEQRSAPEQAIDPATALAAPISGPKQDRTTTAPQQLPADTADFTGHAELVRAAESVLVGGGEQNAVGVVVVVGPPGVGKSAFATHTGHRVAERFPDGQLYCDLRGVSGGLEGTSDVLGRFLLALGIPGAMVPDERDDRLQLYRTLLAKRSVLVVLDDAINEAQVSPLLPGSPTCGVIVTSRTRLTAVPGARRLELEALDQQKSLELLGHITGADRVRHEAEAALALVRAVGGLPLALRIVGARLAARPHWTLASMVDRLANERRKLDELAHGDMTIRASLSLTCDGLDPQSLRLFGLLSIAEGLTLPGWTAGAVLNDDGPYPSDLLEPLVDVHLLEVAGVERTGRFRYRYQDVARLFAREQLAERNDPSGTKAALERMLGGWLALAEDAHRRVYGGDFTVLHGGAPRWRPPAAYIEQLLTEPLDWLEAEEANLCAAVRQAADSGFAELAWDLAVTLVTLFESRGYLDDWERTHTDALAAARASGDGRGTASLLNSLGTLYLMRGQRERSRAVELDALAAFENIDDARGKALCQRDLALLDRQADHYESAYARYEVALHEFDRVDDTVGRAIVLTQSATILHRVGQLAEAHDRLTEALDIYRGVGYLGGIPHTLHKLGQFQLLAGEFDTAAATMGEALRMVRKGGDVIGEGHVLCSIADVHAAADRPEGARAVLEEVLALRERIADHGGAAAVRARLAPLLAALGEDPRAVESPPAAAGPTGG